MRIWDLIIILENYFLVKTLEILIPHIKVKHVISLLVTLILTIESFVLSYLNIDEVLKLFVPVITLLIYSYILKKDFIKNILKVCVVFINLTFIHVLVIMASSLIIGDMKSNFYGDYLSLFILTGLAIVIEGIEYVLLKNHYDSNQKLSKYSLLITTISFIMTFIMINIILKYYMRGEMSYILCVAMILCFALSLGFIVFLCMLNTRYYENNLDQSLRLESYAFESRYTEAIKEKTIEYKKMEHDMKNHFIILNGLVNDLHIQDAKRYIKEINFDTENYYIYVDHLVLNYLLNSKLKVAKDIGIDTSCIVVGEPTAFISDADYSVLIGNLMDNAIEASIVTESKKIKMSLSFYEDKLIVEVKNSVIDKPKSKYFITTKKDNRQHGLGLKNIQEIVDKYQGEDIIEIKNNEFYHMCILYKGNEI